MQAGEQRRPRAGCDARQGSALQPACVQPRFVRMPSVPFVEEIDDALAEHVPMRTQAGVLAVAAGDAKRVFGQDEIGRASCRERVCQYVLFSVVAVSLKKKIRYYT